MSRDQSRLVDLGVLRRMLSDADRDIVRLSREEADRILAIPDRERRMRAYMGLREVWAFSGDQLLPEDESRLQASFAVGSGEALGEAPPPAPPVSLPLTPISLLSWAEAWRGLLVASALRRGAQFGGPADVAALEALLASSEAEPGVYCPEVGFLRQLDALVGALREGLERRQISPGEAVDGHVSNLPGLIRAVTAACSRRDMAVPPVPSPPGLRAPAAALLAWLDDLLAFEEAVGARALVQAGLTLEPSEGRARFLAAARGDADDVAGHAGPQIASWRRAERVQRAAAAALRRGILVRERVVQLPSFDAEEMEAFFLLFAASGPAVPERPAPASPEAALAWWLARRAQALWLVGLNMVSEGLLPPGPAVAEAVERLQGGQMPMGVAGLEAVAQADRVIAACRDAIALGREVPPVADGADAGLILTGWAIERVSSTGQGTAPLRAPAPPVAPAEAPPVPPPAVAAPLSGPEPRLGPALQEPPVVAPAPPRQPLRVTLRAAVDGLPWWVRLGVTALLLVVAYQAAALLLVAAGGGSPSHEGGLRLARTGEWRWLLGGVVLLGAALVLVRDLRWLPGMLILRNWSMARLGRIIAAGLLVSLGVVAEGPARIVSSGAGVPAWPERIVERGGVASSTLNPAEGFWLRQAVVRPVSADDAAAPEPGTEPVALVEEVGPFGSHVRWLLVNRADAASLAGRPLESLETAPPAALRR